MKNKKTIIALATAALVATPLLLTACSCSNNKDNGGDDIQKSGLTSYVTLNSNPGIELLTADNGTVVSAAGTNQDGKTVLYGLDLLNKELAAVVDIVVEEAKKLGLIKDGQTVTTDVVTDQDGSQDLVQETVDTAIKDNNLQTEAAPVDPKISAIMSEYGISEKLATLVSVAKDLVSTPEVELATYNAQTLLNIIKTERANRFELLSEELEAKYETEKDRLESEQELNELKAIKAGLDGLTADSNGNVTIAGKSVNKANIVTAYTQLIADYEALTIDSVPAVTLTQAEIDLIKPVLIEVEAARKAIKDATSGFDTLEDKLEDAEDRLEDILENIEDRFETDDIEVEDLNVYFVDPTAEVADLEVAVEYDKLEMLEELREALVDTLEDTLENDFKIEEDDIEDLFEEALDALEVTAEELEDQLKTTLQAEITAAKTEMQAEKARLEALVNGN